MRGGRLSPALITGLCVECSTAKPCWCDCQRNGHSRAVCRREVENRYRAGLVAKLCLPCLGRIPEQWRLDDRRIAYHSGWRAAPAGSGFMRL
jgi:hypothetical protein